MEVENTVNGQGLEAVGADAQVADANSGKSEREMQLEKELKKVRDESAERRIKIKNFEEQARLREQKELEEQGKFKELLEDKTKELESLSPIKSKYEKLVKSQWEDVKKSLSQEDMTKAVQAGYFVENAETLEDMDRNINEYKKLKAMGLFGVKKVDNIPVAQRCRNR